MKTKILEFLDDYFPVVYVFVAVVILVAFFGLWTTEATKPNFPWRTEKSPITGRCYELYSYDGMSEIPCEYLEKGEIK